MIDPNRQPWSRCAVYVKAFPVATARYGKASADLHSDGLWRLPKMTHEIDLCRDFVSLLNANPCEGDDVSTAVEFITAIRLHLLSLECFKGKGFRILPYGEEVDLDAMLDHLPDDHSDDWRKGAPENNS